MQNGLSRRSSLAALVGALGVGSAASAGGRAEDSAGPSLVMLNSRDKLAAWPRRDSCVLVTEKLRTGLFDWQDGDCTRFVGIDSQRAVYVPASDDPSGKSGAWKRVFDGDIQLTWFGAKFDLAQVADVTYATDDTEAWVAALAYIGAIGGGTLRLPHGASKVTRELTVSCRYLRIAGTGTRGIYPAAFRAGIDCPSTLVPVHAGRSAIRFVATKSGDGSFLAENFGLATLETGLVPQAAFGWETQPAFLYGFTFRGVAIHGFESAFDCYRAGGKENAVGAVLIDDCVINRNQWIARTIGDTQFNGFRFTNNKAGQNGYLLGTGGINISGHDIAIENNILEGMRDPVRVHGAFRDIVVRGNYFEGNVGSACVELRDIRGPYAVGPNNYGLLDYSKIDHKVLLKFCELGSCIDPYWPYGVHKLPPPLNGGPPATRIKNDVDSTRYGFFRLDRLDSMNWFARPPILRSATAPGGKLAREIDPQSGVPIAVSTHRTAGNGQIEHSFTLAGTTGEWIVLSWLFKRLPDQKATTDPYISMKVNGGTAGGSRDYPLYGFSGAWGEGEWCLMTAAIRIRATMQSLLLSLFPYGIRPAKGRQTLYLPPMLYAIDDIGKVMPYIDSWTARSIDKAPTTGDWLAGDILRHASPSPGATKFLCIKAGTPGSWTTV